MDRTLSTTIRQKYLGEKGLVLLIVTMSAIIPLSTDIYLPALPGMGRYFNDTTGLINYTLIAFFAFFGLSTLIWGPISDKFGRKPVLQIGLFTYVIASALCAFSPNVYSIITFRIIQAIGSGAVIAVAGAVVKDSFEGRRREAVMALVQSMAMIAPLVAPSIGAFVLTLTSWKGIFGVLTFFGIAAFVGVMFFEETLEEKHDGDLISSMGRLVHVLKNPSFTILIFIFLLSQIANMGYVASSAYIYINGFHLSEQTYSLFFGLNALFAVVGPLVYIRLLKILSTKKIVLLSFTVMFISGVMVFSLGNISPLFFAMSIIPTTFFAGMTRPLGANLMFNQQEGDSGSASSLMNFAGTVFGSLGMFLVSLNFMNTIKFIGIITICASSTSLILWFLNLKKIRL